MTATPLAASPVAITAPPPRPALLYGAAFIAALSAVAYELLLASYATFLLGGTVFQYSLVISMMMASMGLGALLVGYGGWRKRLNPYAAFLGVEIALAVIASVALPTLYLVFAAGLPARFFVGLFVVGIGMLIGSEIPLVAESAGSPRAFSRILFFDYVGGFVGGILFPLLLVPWLGLFRVAALLGLLNAILAAALLPAFRPFLGRSAGRWITAVVAVTLLATVSLVSAETLRLTLERWLFGIGVVS